MRLSIILLLSRKLLTAAFNSRAVTWLTILVGIMLLMATWLGWSNYQHQKKLRTEYQQLVRKQWVSNPDKHPHRMAHYGYFAFRPKHPLSFFDFGMESFTGVSVFLEAHKQNTVNFSEASLSTGILRFGEMSIAMLLQLLVPLLLLFLGFNAISELKENGTLRIILCQGVSWHELVLGNSLGLVIIAFMLYLPVILITLFFWMILSEFTFSNDDMARMGILLLSYFIYFITWSLITVLISGLSKTSKGSLTTLIAIWLLAMIVLPRTAQALGASKYPTPSKAAFEAALEADLKKVGDPHNPNDPHFKALKDSLLKHYQVDSVAQLPFNYSGFLMQEGEKISSNIYRHRQKALLYRYQKQNSFNRYTAFINPYIAVKNLSMALTGSDFDSYMDFQNQAETFRFGLAQRMNRLQMEQISNKRQGDHDKPFGIGKKHWEETPDFKYEFKDKSFVFKNESLSFAALLFWLLLPLTLLFTLTKKFKSF